MNKNIAIALAYMLRSVVSLGTKMHQAAQNRV